MVTRETLETSAPFTVVHGDTSWSPPMRDGQWELFEADGASDFVLKCAEAMGITVLLNDDGAMLTPMRDDAACQGLDVDDLDACLSYLALGASLVMLPDGDADPTKAYRWYPVFALRSQS